MKTQQPNEENPDSPQTTSSKQQKSDKCDTYYNGSTNTTTWFSSKTNLQKEESVNQSKKQI